MRNRDERSRAFLLRKMVNEFNMYSTYTQTHTANAQTELIFVVHDAKWHPILMRAWQRGKTCETEFVAKKKTMMMMMKKTQKHGETKCGIGRVAKYEFCLVFGKVANGTLHTA